MRKIIFAQLLLTTRWKTIALLITENYFITTVLLWYFSAMLFSEIKKSR